MIFGKLMSRQGGIMDYKFWLGLRNGLIISLFLWAIIFIGICFAQDAKSVATEIVKTQLKLDSTTISNADVSKVLDDKIQAQIDEAIERIRRQKIDEAKKYEPTDKEIADYLQKKLDKMNEPVVPFGVIK